ncbi:MAG: hypothetical protein J7L41_08740 [Synergistetes bacterium]|nr:hypothetical protein [Synergistota bacterium]
MRFLPFAMVILLAFFTSGVIVDYFNRNLGGIERVEKRRITTATSAKHEKDYSLIWKILDADVGETHVLKNITGGELLLVGISVGEENRAVIRDVATGEIKVVKEGDSFGNLKVLKIQRDRVIFGRGRDHLYLTFVYSKGSTTGRTVGKYEVADIRSEGNNRYVISRSFLFSHFSNVSKLLTRVNVAPYFRDKEIKGYVIRWLSSKSVLRRMGLRTGDIVREINGISLKQPQDIFNIMKSAMSSDIIRVRITRGNKDIVLEYDVR